VKEKRLLSGTFRNFYRDISTAKNSKKTREEATS